MFTIFFKYLLSFNILAKSSLSVDVRKQLNIQEAFSSEQAHSKTENANLSCREPKTPTALKLSVGVFDPPRKSILVERGYHGYQNSAVSWHLPSRNFAYSMLSLISGAKTRPEFSPFLKFCDKCRF